MKKCRAILAVGKLKSCGAVTDGIRNVQNNKAPTLISQTVLVYNYRFQKVARCCHHMFKNTPRLLYRLIDSLDGLPFKPPGPPVFSTLAPAETSKLAATPLLSCICRCMAYSFSTLSVVIFMSFSSSMTPLGETTVAVDGDGSGGVEVRRLSEDRSAAHLDTVLTSEVTCCNTMHTRA